MTVIEALVVNHFGWSSDIPGSEELYRAAGAVLKSEQDRIRAAAKPPPLWVVVDERTGHRIQFFGIVDEARKFARDRMYTTRVAKYVEVD